MSNSDLSGKIVFKVKLDQEIKKIVIHNDDINYNELLLMMQRIFSETIKPNDEFTIKYTDEENDLITLANDSDVLLALQNSKILKLTIFLKDKEETKEELKQDEIVKELQNIRLSIDRFLDKFERALVKSGVNHHKVDELTRATSDIKLSNSNSNIVKNDAHKEFDPLAKKNDTNDTKLPMHNSGAQTPDSIAHETSFQSNTNIGLSKPPQFNQLNAGTNDANVHQHSNSDLAHHQQIQLQQQQQHQQYLQQQQQAQQQAYHQQLQAPQPPQAQQIQQPTAQLKPTQVVQQPQFGSQQFYQSNPQTQPQLGAPNQLQNQPPNRFMPTAQFPNQQQPALGQPTTATSLDPKYNQQQQQLYQPQPQMSLPQQPDQQHQQYIQQQQQAQPTGMMPPHQQQPQANFSPQIPNPYSKNISNPALNRPPSATLYQQGYK